MHNLDTVHVTFTCSHCGSTNEITAANVHEATVIHCSKCRTSIASLRLLRDKSTDEQPVELSRVLAS